MDVVDAEDLAERGKVSRMEADLIVKGTDDNVTRCLMPLEDSRYRIEQKPLLGAYD